MIILVILDVRGTNWLHFLSFFFSPLPFPPFFPHVGKIWPSLKIKTGPNLPYVGEKRGEKKGERNVPPDGAKVLLILLVHLQYS